MIERAEYVMIRDLKNKGLNKTQIAEALDLDRKTVTKWLGCSELPNYQRKSAREGKLDSYHAYLLERMNQGCVNAMILFDEFKKMGYGGRMTILRDFMKLHREQARSKATIRFETPPGRQTQVDKAESIAVALDFPLDQLFQIQGNAKPLATKTVLEHHRLIRTILGQAEKELMVPYNAASKATPPKVRRTSVNRFEPAEITAILEALESEPIKWRTIIHLMIVTGCRRGEIMGLKWTHVNLDQGILLICETLLASDSGVYTDTPKTSESQRAINIPPETVTLLLEHRKEQEQTRLVVGDRWQETDYVFSRENGLPMHPDSVNGWLKQFSERHGLPHINPHAFRHSMASILINSGTDILSISKRLGHSMTSTTLNIYGHVLNQADARSSECIADTLLRNDKNRTS